MAQYYHLCLTMMYATCLENKRGHKPQSPTVAFLISPGNRWVLSTPAKNGGENPRWNGDYTLLCEERYYEFATLTMIIFHKGKKYETILGVVGNISVSKLKQRSLQLPVLSESGKHGGGFLNLTARVVPPPPPPLRSFTVTVHSAQGLKNVKRFWKRISLRNLRVRKMKPYLVVDCNRSSEPRWVSPIAGKDGTNPEFNFSGTFKCRESLIQQDKVNVAIAIHHRHKAEHNYGSSDWPWAEDIKIGTVERIKISPMEMRRDEYHEYRLHVPVVTPKRKYGGRLNVSVALSELEEPEHESLTPSPWNTSWELRIRPPQRGYPETRDLAELLRKCLGLASKGVIPGLGIATLAA